MSELVLELEAIVRVFSQGENRLEVLRGCSVAVRAGEKVALIGPSGSGKSTLLHIAGLLERPDGGAVRIAGRDTAALPEKERTLTRRKTVGFVYQFHHLLPEFSARENIALPCMIDGWPRAKALLRADDLLALVGLSHRADHRPAQLSGGEQQRVAIARALANGPRLLIADEPTGNLDPETAEHVFAVLQALVASQNLALFMATHNEDLAARMDRTVVLREGKALPIDAYSLSRIK